MADNKNSKKLKGQELSDSICILPFVSMSINAGGYLSRCQMSEKIMGQFENTSLLEAWNSQKMDSLRKDMKQGVWDAGCNSCKSKENLGLKSKRKHWMNLQLVKDLWQNPQTFNKHPINDIYHVDIAFSNYCNFKCRMCGPGYSSRWVGDEQQLIEKGITGGAGGFAARTSSLAYSGPAPSISDEELKSLALHMKKVRRIEVLGGEPFLTREFLEFLRLCQEYGVSEQTELMVTTNGSVLNKETLDLLSPFNYVNLNISVDATGPYFSYMRSSGSCDWEKLEKNVTTAIKYCAEQSRDSTKRNWKVNLNGTFQTYNMLNIDSFLNWIEKMHGWNKNAPVQNSKNRNSFEHRILMGPRHLSTLFAPNELINLSREKLSLWMSQRDYWKVIDETGYLNDIQKTLDSALKINPEEKQKQWFMFCWYTASLDEIRKENLADVDPILFEFVEKTWRSTLYQSNIKKWRDQDFSKNNPH